ncbi:MAG: hypothetical protein AB1757_03375 [Acidobacteriota bacterium]
MPRKNKFFVWLLTFSLLCSCTTVAFPSIDDTKEKKQGKKEKENGGDEKAKAVMWQEPTDLESRDLFYGPGGAAGAPDPNDTFKFIRRVTSGTSEKMEVEDPKGRSWTVKLGAETRPETTATRLVWAVGYHVDQDYFVKLAKIDGRGGFDVANTRFERRDDGYKEVKNNPIWSWTEGGQFAGTKELQGLKALMALLNNWDLKDINNKVIRPDKESGGDRNMQIYYVGDLGGTLGSTGSAFRKIPGFGSAPAGSKGDPDDFAGQTFILGTKDGKVLFNYKGKNRKALEDVSVEAARWMGNLLGRLSDKQLGDAFRAGGFSESETAIYIRAMRSRINQLKNLR